MNDSAQDVPPHLVGSQRVVPTPSGFGDHRYPRTWNGFGSAVHEHGGAVADHAGGVAGHDLGHAAGRVYPVHYVFDLPFAFNPGWG